MKRDILFRGKSIESGLWVEGLLHFSHGQGLWAITQSNGWVPSYNNPDEGEQTIYIEVDPATVGQFTWLTDKNGTKIFEGDIVKWDDRSKGKYWRVAVVEISPDIRFRIVKNNVHELSCEAGKVFNYGNFIYKDTEKDLYVLGNIHDNPELLK